MTPALRLISVILPVHNVAPYLRECMESVINQTYKNLEIICVDDGSTDESPAILDEYAARDPRVRVIHQRNRGVSVARNTGLDLASGECVAFVDTDDYLEPTAYEIAVSKMSDDVDVVYFLPKIIGDDCPRKKWYEKNYGRIVPEGCYGIEDELVISHLDFNHVWCKLFRRSAIEREHIRYIAGFRYEDVDFSMKFACTCRGVYMLPLKLYNYRVAAQSFMASTNGGSASVLDFLKILGYTIRFMNERGYWNSKLRLRQYVLRMVLHARMDAVRAGFTPEANRLLGRLAHKWKLYEIPMGNVEQEAFLRECAVTPWKKKVVRLFYRKSQDRTRYCLLGIPIIDVSTVQGKQRYSLFGIKCYFGE